MILSILYDKIKNLWKLKKANTSQKTQIQIDETAKTTQNKNEWIKQVNRGKRTLLCQNAQMAQAIPYPILRIGVAVGECWDCLFF